MTATRLSSAVRPTAAILTYHSIAAETSSMFARLTVDPQLFAEHVAALHESGLECVPFSEVPAALAAGRSTVSITIDDGLADVADNACPVLADHGLPSTLFVPSGYVGDRADWLPGRDGQRPLMSAAQLRELASEGFEIASHGRLHLAADVNAPAAVAADARASREELETIIGAAVDSFAYPFGYHSPAARRVIRAAGYRQACAVGDLHAETDDDRWALPRLQVWGSTSAEQLLELIRSRPGSMTRATCRAKQTVWRTGRRFLDWGPTEAGRRTATAGALR